MTDVVKKESKSRVLNIYVGVLLGFLALPMIIVIPSAFSAGSSLTFPPQGLSLKWFSAILDQPEFLQSFLNSLIVATCSSIISLVVGTITALTFHRHVFPGKQLFQALLMTPLVFPAIVLAVAMALVLGPLGLLRTYTGLVGAHVLITLPYVFRTVGATVAEIDPSLVEAAQTLGANRFQSFWRVTLPLLRPGLIAGGTFALITSFDEFTVSLFLVGSGMNTLPIAMYNYAEFTLDPTLAAISALLMVITFLSIVVIEKLAGFGRQFE